MSIHIPDEYLDYHEASDEPSPAPTPAQEEPAEDLGQ
jgi:hypothetical protein